MRHVLLFVLALLPGSAHAWGVLDWVSGPWAIGSVANCTRSPYALVVTAHDGSPVLSFRDSVGQVNDERVDSQRENGVTTTTLRSPDVPPGTRWDYAASGTGTFIVRNLSNGKQFTIVRCPAPATRAEAGAGKRAPAFSDPVALIAWLIANSGRGFIYQDDAATANVFSPGLRVALQASALRSMRENQPPCGADGDIILATQEEGTAQNLKLSAQTTAPDRVTVAASFDIVGYHRDRRYMTVILDGVWKLENILESTGTSLRRSLDCR